MNQDKNELGKYIDEMRKRHKVGRRTLSKSQMALAVGLNVNAVQQLIAGKTGASPKTLKALASQWGTNEDYRELMRLAGHPLTESAKEMTYQDMLDMWGVRHNYRSSMTMSGKKPYEFDIEIAIKKLSNTFTNPSIAAEVLRDAYYDDWYGVGSELIRKVSNEIQKKEFARSAVQGLKQQYEEMVRARALEMGPTFQQMEPALVAAGVPDVMARALVESQDLRELVYNYLLLPASDQKRLLEIARVFSEENAG